MVRAAPPVPALCWSASALEPSVTATLSHVALAAGAGHSVDEPRSHHCIDKRSFFGSFSKRTKHLIKRNVLFLWQDIKFYYSNTVKTIVTKPVKRPALKTKHLNCKTKSSWFCEWLWSNASHASNILIQNMWSETFRRKCDCKSWTTLDKHIMCHFLTSFSFFVRMLVTGSHRLLTRGQTKRAGQWWSSSTSRLWTDSDTRWEPHEHRPGCWATGTASSGTGPAVWEWTAG